MRNLSRVAQFSLRSTRFASDGNFAVKEQLLRRIDSVISQLPPDRDAAFNFKDYLESVVKPALESPGGSLNHLSEEKLTKLEKILTRLQENQISKTHYVPFDKFRGAVLKPEQVPVAIEALSNMKD